MFYAHFLEHKTDESGEEALSTIYVKQKFYLRLDPVDETIITKKTHYGESFFCYSGFTRSLLFSISRITSSMCWR